MNHAPNNLKLVRTKIHCPLIVARIVEDDVARDVVPVQASLGHHGLEGEENVGASVPIFTEIIGVQNKLYQLAIRSWKVDGETDQREHVLGL